MDAITMLKERRSIRKFKELVVPRDVMYEIVSLSTYSPTWGNTQIVRYNIIDNKEILDKIASDGFNNFKPNANIFSKAMGAVVVSHETGKSGRSLKGEYMTVKRDAWDMFDAGIACQTLCLAAYEKGVGTVIMGIFDEVKVAEIIKLPEGEVVSAIIAYGYEDGHPKPTPRKSVDEVIRYID